MPRRRLATRQTPCLPEPKLRPVFLEGKKKVVGGEEVPWGVALIFRRCFQSVISPLHHRPVNKIRCRVLLILSKLPLLLILFFLLLLLALPLLVLPPFRCGHLGRRPRFREMLRGNTPPSRLTMRRLVLRVFRCREPPPTASPFCSRLLFSVVLLLPRLPISALLPRLPLPLVFVLLLLLLLLRAVILPQLLRSQEFFPSLRGLSLLRAASTIFLSPLVLFFLLVLVLLLQVCPLHPIVAVGVPLLLLLLLLLEAPSAAV